MDKIVDKKEGKKGDSGWEEEVLSGIRWTDRR